MCETAEVRQVRGRKPAGIALVAIGATAPSQALINLVLEPVLAKSGAWRAEVRSIIDVPAPRAALDPMETKRQTIAAQIAALTAQLEALR